MDNRNNVIKIAQKISLLLIVLIVVFGLWSGIAHATLSITTRNPSNVSHSSVVLNGVLNEGSLSITAWFELGTNPNNLTLSTSPKYYNSLSDNYSAPVSGLNSSTTYYFRAVAENSQGRVYGNILSFKTSYDPYYDRNYINNQSYYNSQPTITTNPAINIGANGAILNGFVNGNNLSTTAWFEWGTNTNFANSTTQKYYGNNVSNFNITLTELLPNTVYYFRAVAENSRGRVFGNTVSFTTSFTSYINYTNQETSSKLEAKTSSVTNIYSTGAQLNGLIINNGTIPSNTYFEWGTSTRLGNKTTIISTGVKPIVKHLNTITGLRPNTGYYFRAVAENNLSRSVGEITYFKTNPAISGKTNNPSISAGVKDNAIIKSVDENDQLIIDLGANVLGVGFLPGNSFGWLILIIFILILVLLMQYSFYPRALKQENTENH